MSTVLHESTAQQKWFAFLLSLAAPGCGQLYAKSWSCLLWFGLTFAMLAIVCLLPMNVYAYVAISVVAAAVAVASAEHAKRLLEGSQVQSAVVDSRSIWLPRSGARVAMRIEVRTTYTAARLWRKVANLKQFLTIDPFHEKVVLMRPQPAAGVDLVLWHCAFGIRFPRYGRILRWQAPDRFAVSDLSARGNQVGFPHVFFVSVKPTDRGSLLQIDVCGRWRHPLIPKPLGKLWLKYVCAEHARLLRKGL